MTTTRERMKALSGLIGAHSAREHFLAITQGTGVDRTIFASSMVVSVENSRMEVVRQRKVVAEQVCSTTQPAAGAARKRIDAVTQANKVFATARVENLYVIQTKRCEQIVNTRASALVFNRRRVVSTI